MDSLDIRLLRAMFREHVYEFRGVDPRLTVQTLSRTVDASRLTVQRRLLRWREEGFWRGVVAFPNPDLFHASFQMQGIFLVTERDRARLERSIDRLLRSVFVFQADDVYTPVLLAEPSDD